MQIATALAAAVMRRMGGQVREFPRLTLGDWAKLQALMGQQQREARDGWVQSLLAAGLKPAQVPALIRELDRPATAAEVWAFVLSPEGARQAVLLSLRRSDPQASAEAVDGLAEPLELVELAAEVAGLKFADGEESVPDPLAGISTSPTG